MISVAVRSIFRVGVTKHQPAVQAHIALHRLQDHDPNWERHRVPQLQQHIHPVNPVTSCNPVMEKCIPLDKTPAGSHETVRYCKARSIYPTPVSSTSCKSPAHRAFACPS